VDVPSRSALPVEALVTRISRRWDRIRVIGEVLVLLQSASLLLEQGALGVHLGILLFVLATVVITEALILLGLCNPVVKLDAATSLTQPKVLGGLILVDPPHAVLDESRLLGLDRLNLEVNLLECRVNAF